MPIYALRIATITFSFQADHTGSVYIYSFLAVFIARCILMTFLAVLEIIIGRIYNAIYESIIGSVYKADFIVGTIYINLVKSKI